MEAAKAEAVARFTEAWRNRRVDPILTCVEPDIVVDWSNSIGPFRGVYRGVDGLRSVFEAFADAWSEVHWTAVDATPFGPDRLFLATQLDVRGRDSGVETVGRGAQLWTFRGDRVAAIKLFQSPAEGRRWLRRDRLDKARLYFVCDGRPGGGDPEPILNAALEGGADIVQLREKAPRCEEELLSFAEPFRRSANDHGALFVLNDAPESVAATAADGVHVGQDDVSVAEARATAGAGAIVGLSTHSPGQLDAACAAEGDARPEYISVGPVWETPTKPGRPAAGLEYVRYAAANADLPWFAIGGIDATNIGEVAEAGATRIVVVRAIRDAADPSAATASLRAGIG
jgi:thiamine-phosphate pyrophosphorylase